MTSDYYRSWYSAPSYAPAKKKVKDNWKTFGDWGGNTWTDTYWDSRDALRSYSTSTKSEEEKVKDAKLKKCKESLASIGRSANVILNSPDNSKEKSMTVKFSTGKNVNRHDDGVIYISPDKILAADTDEKRGEVIDALCGEVMLASQIRRQIPVSVVSSFNKTKKQSVRALFSAIETATARNAISQEWEGFKPYFDAYSDITVEGEYEKIKELITSHDGNDGNPTSSYAFIRAVSWNLYHVNHPIPIPEVYAKAKEIIKLGLCSAVTPEERLAMCRSAVYKIEKMYDKKKDEEENPEGEKKIEEKWSDFNAGIDKNFFGFSKFQVENKEMPSAALIAEASGKEKDEEECPVKFEGYGTSEELSIGERSLPIWCKPDHKPELSYSDTEIRDMDAKAESLASLLYLRGISDSRKVYNASYGKVNTKAIHRFVEEEETTDSDKVFYHRKEDTSDKASVCILIDQSGSMSAKTEGQRRIESAREIGYIIAKVCQKSDDIDLTIIGFSAQEQATEAKFAKVAGKGEVNLRMVYSSTGSADIRNILHMEAHSNNIDGYSIWYAAQKICESKVSYSKKVMIVVSDGQPCANGYSGDVAIAHVGHAVKDVRNRFNMSVYGIGACSAFHPKIGELMYGKNNFSIVSGMSQVMRPISRIISKLV